MVFDFDNDVNIIGLEILNASQRTDNPQSIEYTIQQAISPQ
ncbi:MAG: hypothetical protein ACFCA4_15715 [Cyanophyceae cyanobacterium]